MSLKNAVNKTGMQIRRNNGFGDNICVYSETHKTVEYKDDIKTILRVLDSVIKQIDLLDAWKLTDWHGSV